MSHVELMRGRLTTRSTTLGCGSQGVAQSGAWALRRPGSDTCSQTRSTILFQNILTTLEGDSDPLRPRVWQTALYFLSLTWLARTAHVKEMTFIAICFRHIAGSPMPQRVPEVHCFYYYYY